MPRSPVSGTRVQSLIFRRKRDPKIPGSKGWTKTSAQAWAEDHGFKAPNTAITIEDKYVHIRQEDPKAFKAGAFGPGGKLRTVDFGHFPVTGIRARVGVPKKAATSPKRRKKRTR